MSDEIEAKAAEYPRMLYKGGNLPKAGVEPKVGDDYVIVADAGEEAHAVKEGYSRHDAKAEKAAK